MQNSNCHGNWDICFNRLPRSIIALHGLPRLKAGVYHVHCCADRWMSGIVNCGSSLPDSSFGDYLSYIRTLYLYLRPCSLCLDFFSPLSSTFEINSLLYFQKNAWLYVFVSFQGKYTSIFYCLKLTASFLLKCQVMDVLLHFLVRCN